jgi:Zn-dependent protease
MSEGESPIFYRVCGNGMTMREFSWGSKNPILLLFVGLRKLLKLPDAGGSTDDPPVESLQPFEVASLPEEIREKFEPLAYELTALGFVEPVYHAITDPLNFTTHYWATFRHASGNGFGRIHMRIWTKPHPARIQLFPIFISAFSDGTFMFSSAGQPDVESPPGTIVLRKQGMGTATLWQEHEKTLQTAGKTIYQLVDEGSLRWAIGAYHTATRDFHLKRGAFKKLTEQDASEAAILQRAHGTGSPHADVLAEIEILQKGSATWKNSLWLLIVSGAAFFIAGGMQDSFRTALLLIVILLFHEAGHYVAMHIFKYRNLKMFFIPLLGAAVSGQSYNVAAWKKVVVSLAGPLPGIVLGIALAFAGMRRESEWAIDAGEMFIFINAFNLLPLLPFDGGRVVGTILFSRHYILDTVFRAVAAIAIILLGFALDAQLLFIVGAFSLMALRASLKMANVTEKIREQKLPMLAEDRESIPPDTANQIITQLKEKFTKGSSTKLLAQQTLTIFETLNQKPPGWMASISLLALHGGAFLVAMGVFFYVASNKNGGIARYDRPARIPLNVANIKTWSGAEANFLVVTQSVAVVATFQKEPLAAKAFGELSSSLPPVSESLLFGNTLFVRLPATNQEWRARIFSQLTLQTTNIFVERTNYAAQMKLAFAKPNKETKESWLAELENFFNAQTDLKLVPPWAPPALLDPKGRAGFMLARRTMRLLATGDDEDESTRTEKAARRSQFMQEFKEIQAAERAGDDEKVKAIYARREEAREAAETKRIERVRKMPETEAHRGVIDAYMKYPDDTNSLPAYRDSRRKLERLMGSLRGAEPELARYGIVQGYMMDRVGQIQLREIQFADSLFNAPRLAKWLDAQGAKDLRYNIEGIEAFASDESEDEPE